MLWVKKWINWPQRKVSLEKQACQHPTWIQHLHRQAVLEKGSSWLLVGRRSTGIPQLPWHLSPPLNSSLCCVKMCLHESETAAGMLAHLQEKKKKKKAALLVYFPLPWKWALTCEWGEDLRAHEEAERRTERIWYLGIVFKPALLDETHVRLQPWATISHYF